MDSVQAGLGSFGLLILWACIPSKKEADLQVPLFLPVELISVLFHCGIVFTLYNLRVKMLTLAFFCLLCHFRAVIHIQLSSQRY